eukprot:TRINITY_DN6194_c0_g2_i1.p1 TRINITY_DN6194_c0_g2~~TRINITY_DN6194_c0_g2_i1.p1  ORF type:complete len:753 (+),score=136.47 TRINITY_DN6194_c0_g2_i1:25-2283(+)
MPSKSNEVTSRPAANAGSSPRNGGGNGMVAAWNETGIESKLSSSISLRNSIMILSVCSVITVAIACFLPSYLLGVAAVENISDQLQDQTMDRIKNQVQGALDIPHEILRAINSTIEGWAIETHESHCNHYEARRAFFGITNGTKYISQAYYGSNDGSLIGIATDSGPPSLMCSDKTTAYNITFYYPINSPLVDTPIHLLNAFSYFPAYNATKRAWYRAAVQSNSPTWGAVYASFTPAGILLALAAVRPIYDIKTHKIIVGVSTVELNLNLVQEILDEIKTSENGYAYILQKDTRVIANTLGTPIVDQTGYHFTYLETKNDLIIKSANKLERESGNKLLSSIKGTKQYSIEDGGDEFFVFASTLADPRGGIEWTIVVLIPREDIYSKIDEMILLSTTLTASLFIVIMAVSLLASNWISKPLQYIADALKSVSRLDFHEISRRQSTSNLREIQMIQSSFLAMDKTMQSINRMVPMNEMRKMLDDEKNNANLEKKTVSVLFAGVKGLDKILEGIESATAADMLSEYFEEVSSLAIITKGVIIDSVGSKITVVWNGPEKNSDHVLWSCIFALRWKKTFEQLSFRWKLKGFTSMALSVQIGINTGVSHSGNVGSMKRKKYDTIGSTAIIASRLERLNNRYKSNILISDGMKACLPPRMLNRPLEECLLENGDCKLLVHELLADTEEDSSGFLSQMTTRLEGAKIFHPHLETTTTPHAEMVRQLEEYCSLHQEDESLAQLLRYVSHPDYKGVLVLQDW